MSAEPLSILIIDEDPSRSSLIEAALRQEGHERVFSVDTINGVAKRIADIEPDVIVIDLANPNRDMLENLFSLTRTVQRPIAMFVDRSDRASMEAAIDAGVSAYVVDGLRSERIKPILDMAVSRFNAYTRMLDELEKAKSELAARKIIDRAKGILMKAKGLSEEEAYGILRKTAMNQNRKIVEVAESLVMASEIMGDE